MTEQLVTLTVESLQTPAGVAELNRMLQTLFLLGPQFGDLLKIFSGMGSPETTVAADIGALYLRKDGGATTTLYVKESGAGTATGWVAK